jgi:DNA-directed RNA polymerase subunit RPC12/RpoP
MPTAMQGDNIVHTCQYCGHQQSQPRNKPLPFMFNGYRCTSCDRPLDDLDYALLAEAARPPK